MGKVKKILIVILVVILISAGTFYVAFKNEQNKAINHPIKSNNKEVRVVVKSGDSFYSVLDNLKSQGELQNIYLIKWHIKNNNIKINSIKPGSYVLKSDLSLDNFIKNLSTGVFDENTVKITFPEGYNIEQMATLLQDKGVITKDAFILSIKNYPLPTYIKKDTNRKYALEGFLFPDTYEIIKSSSGNDIIKMLLKRFEAVMLEVQKENNATIKLDDYDKLINMASIVEKEAEKDSERAKVSSVFYNRLNIKMKLQSCATVLYAMGYHKDKLSNEDIKIKSLYNTYIVDGMPEGPIASPGKESIKAALVPETTKFIYFVSNNDGTHFFTDNYQKFLDVKAKTQGN